MPVLNKCMEGSVKQDLRMKRGNIKEDKNLDKTQQKRNIVIDSRNSQMYERELYIDPEECIDCGACEPECPVEAIFEEDEVPDEWSKYIPLNYKFFGQEAP